MPFLFFLVLSPILLILAVVLLFTLRILAVPLLIAFIILLVTRGRHRGRSQWTQPRQQQWQRYGRSQYRQEHHRERKAARDVKVQDDDWSDF
ncbi:hypothetical protein [Loigolactobacillus jiayinensis]|uniref:Membrane protein FxsA n=1 Tax=Loigolactobacillus jiayinensis TaxID=2486016 RepID=A0ABW1RFK3_9LACO|nr:hypothetical protein [Loigolactobacillus jiayinensis]